MEVTQTAKNALKECLKVRPFQCYTKIQEAYPVHYSNLINKELGYDALVQAYDDADPIKIKNCICSARPNSQLFKRFSKTLISNIKNEIDQLYFFASVNSVARLETSIGLQTNPGIFLIVGLTYLDEKYKQPYQRCDIEFSFLEYREGAMYDLLCFTGQPLQPQLQSSNFQLLNFKEHWVKAMTFNQFIKLFKIALFNNKQRDFKSENKSGKCKSTFIMKTRSKIYSVDDELLKENETVLVDFQVNCLKEISFKQKSNRSILDYFLIEINNSNPNNKPIHYHMVQENHLLLLLKKYLPKLHASGNIEDDKKADIVTGSQVTFIYSFPAQKESFQAHQTYLQNILSHFNDSWQVRVRNKARKIKVLNEQFVRSRLKGINCGVSLKTYSSLRSFNSFKIQLITEMKKCKHVIREFRRLITDKQREKLNIQFLKNELIAYQFKLIGSCIKSDHFKDFYSAKSYLQLEREIAIKTETIKEEIKLKVAQIDEIEKTFLQLKKRETENLERYREQNAEIYTVNKQHTPFESLSNTKYEWNKLRDQEGKFKKLTPGKGNQIEELHSLITYLHNYMHNLWDIVSILDERTIFGSVQFQTAIIAQEQRLNELISKFTEDIFSISETDIMYDQENNIYNNNEMALFRSLNFLGLMGPKKQVKGMEIGKRLMIQSHGRPKDKQKTKEVTRHKLPEISKKTITIVGELKMSELLCNPQGEMEAQNPCLLNI